MKRIKIGLYVFIALTMILVCTSCGQNLDNPDKDNMPTGIILKDYSLSLETGDECILQYELSPATSVASVTFSSSDYSVINIIEGKLVAVSQGFATVTVETENHIIAACNITVVNKPALSQMTDDETEFFNALLSNINVFNVPSSVRVVRIKPLEENNGKYLAMLNANNRLGTTLSGQYIIAANEIEESSEIIQTSDPKFNISLINQAIEEYWGLSNLNIVDKEKPEEDGPSSDDEKPIVQRENCDFRNCKWGDTVEDVKLYDTTIKIVSDKENCIAGTDTVSGYSATVVSYLFDTDGKLYEGIYGFSYKKKETWEYISMYNSLVEKLTEMYGKPSKNEIVPLTMQSLIDMAGTIDAVKLGYVVYYAEWETSTTHISIMLMTENYSTELAIAYKDINCEESSNNNGL